MARAQAGQVAWPREDYVLAPGSWRPLASLLVVVLLTLPSAAAAAILQPPVVAAPAYSLSQSTAAAGMRTPDASALEGDVADRAVTPPPTLRAPLAAPVNWTVLVYMVADNGLEPFAIQDLNEMESAPASASVRMAVEVDRAPGNDASNGDWTEARRYLIGHDSDTATVTSALVASMGELDMGDPQTLANFLVWGVDTYPAAHYMVVLWDHGFGLSGFGEDETDNDHLSLGELTQALAAGASHLGRPFDLLAFDACLMQSVEAAYEFAWLADFQVAAQDREPAAGWPYASMLAPLVEDPSISPEALAGALVPAYVDPYGAQGETMMSAVRMSSVRTVLFDAVSALGSEIAAVVEDPGTANASSAEQAIRDARAGSPAMFTGEAYDLGEFTRLLSEDARLPASLRSAASAARQALNTTLVDEAHSLYYTGWSGMSVYLPSIGISPRYPTTAFAKDGYWDEALTAFLSGVPSGGLRPSLQVLSPSPGEAVARRFGSSVSVTLQGGGEVTAESKAGWADFAPVAQGAAPLQASAVLDAGADSGDVVFTFRAVSASGVPSTTVERLLHVEAPLVTFAPALTELAVAVNRTRTVNLTLTPRSPYPSFDIGWSGLPPGVSGAGTTGAVSLSTAPPPPFNITLQLSANASAVEGASPVTLFVRSASTPSVVAYLDLDLLVTRPLPDLAVAPIVLSQDLPLPSEVVDAASEIANLGFEDIALARITAVFTDTGGNVTEVANFTVGPLHPGDRVPWTGNFTAARGTQRLELRVSSEPPGALELNASNNVQSRTVEVVNFSVALRGPPGTARASLGPTPTAIELELQNRGTEADTYDLSVANLSNATWQVALVSTTATLPGRNTTTITVDVLLPAAAQGGDEATFEVGASSRGDGLVAASASIRVAVNESYGATLRPQPSDLELDARGTANVTLLLQNTGNGRETFTLSLEAMEPKLQARVDAATFTLSPSQAASAHLTLTDAGLSAADRPYTVEAVAVSDSSGMRFTAIVSVRVRAAPALAVEPLEPHLAAPANGTAEFHVRLTNTGNTNLIPALAALGADPNLTITLPPDAGLLEPGAAAVVNGTTHFAAPPFAGPYKVTLSAADARLGVSVNATFEVRVEAVHDLRTTLSVAAGEGTRTLVRNVLVENFGNTPEPVTVLLGYVPVGTRVELEPANDTFVVPPGQNVTLKVRIFGPADAGASGAIELVLIAEGGTLSRTFQVSYDFTAPPPPPILEWLAVVGLAAACLGLWVFATRKRAPPAPPPP